MYKVEEILDKRLEPKTKKQQYLIKWDGYDLQVSTWEPIEHLEYCIDIVKEFQKKLAGQKEKDINQNDLPQRNKNTRTRQGKPEQLYYKWSNRLRIKSEICYNPEAKDPQEDNEEFPVQEQVQQILNKRPLQLKLRNGKKKSKQLKLPNQELQSEERGTIQKMSNRNNYRKKKLTLSTSKDGMKIKKTAQQTKKTKQISKKEKLAFKHLLKKKRRQKKRQSNVKHENQSQKSVEMQIESKLQPKEELFQRPETPIRVPQTKRSESQKQIKIRHNDDENQRKADQLNQDKDSAKVEVIGMRRISQAFEFFLQKGSIEGWSTHKFVLDNYPRELCAFYEKNIEFQ